MNSFACKSALVLFITFALVDQVSADQPWVSHDSFEDFAAGSLGCGGANLYVARRGRVEMIQRMDLNNDGHLDLFAANDHNDVEGADVLIYWGAKDGPRSLIPPLADHLPKFKLIDEIVSRQKGVGRLPSDGGGRSTLADLNNDGLPEIIFCNFKHNYTVFSKALIYWNSLEGFDAQRRTELPTILPGGVAAADFNQDGFVDLAFANRGNFEHQSFVPPNWHLESYIYWNGPLGFDEKRRTSIPTISAVDCVAGDLNDDGFPELVFLNNNREHKSIYIYWGSSEGFDPSRREVRETTDPTEATLADLNADGHLEFIVNHRLGPLEIFRGVANGVEKDPWLTLPAAGANDVEADDLNKDGFTDLVVAGGGKESKWSYVCWGDESGFDAERRVKLPTQKASDAALADFNGDGWVDIAFANERSDYGSDVNSYIYWNGPEGFDPDHRSELLGYSPDAAEADDLNGDGHPDLVLISHSSGSGGPEGLDSLIYWGNRSHHYSPDSTTGLAGCGAVGIADLDQDGRVDVVGAYYGLIYWAKEDGYEKDPIDPNERTDGAGVAIADLNRDGYLDLVMPTGFRFPHPPPGHTPKPTSGMIYWGNENGYDNSRRTDLPLQTSFSQSVRIADLNKDGELDLIFPELHTGMMEIYWGYDRGTYSPDRHVRFHGHRASTVEIADLNRDGWLDLVLGGGWDVVDNWGRATKEARIMWGSNEGYSRDRSIVLEAFDSLEQSVADLNKDGFLDIVMTNYHAYFTRRLPAFIYWGASDGSYSNARRTSLPAESSSAVTIADLNHDGWMDLFVCNHVIEGDHTVGSNIFWGGPEGYSGKRRQWLPTFGPHFSAGWDVGNLYDRSPQEEYISAPLEIPAGRSPTRLSWTAQTPHRTGVKFQMRSAPSSELLEQSSWTGLEGEGSFFTNSPSKLTVSAESRWLQYRAILVSEDGGSTPYLDSVQIDVTD
jgi:hypothetical protein